MYNFFLAPCDLRQTRLILQAETYGCVGLRGHTFSGVSFPLVEKFENEKCTEFHKCDKQRLRDVLSCSCFQFMN